MHKKHLNMFTFVHHPFSSHRAQQHQLSRLTFIVLFSLAIISPQQTLAAKRQRINLKSGSDQGSFNKNFLPSHSDNKNEQHLASVAINGSGAYTEWLTETPSTEEGQGTDENQVPLIPNSIKVRPTAKTISVSWTPPKNTAIVVRGYTIGWGIGFPDVFTQIVDGQHRSFTIEDLRPTSEYVISLRAFDNVGDGQPTYETVKTLVEDEPDPLPILPPVGLKVDILSHSTVVLHWTDTSLPRSQNVQDSRYYTVKYSSNFHTNSPKYKMVNTTNLNTMIDDLKPNTQYEFAVKVSKGRQESTWSMSVINTTQEAAPTSPPRDLTIVPSEDDSTIINVHWQPPKQPNGRITGYVIFYTQDNSLQDRDWAVEAVVGDKMTAILKDLQPDTIYYYKIQARNHKGPGPLSSEVSFRTMSISYAAKTFGGKGISTQTLYIAISAISIVTILLLLVVSILLCKSKRGSVRKKGYVAAATTSPRSKTPSKTKGNVRVGDPPDLWIHHEQMELKAMEKNQKDNLEATIARTVYQDSPDDLDTRKSQAYIPDALYDDVAKGPSSPNDAISYLSGTSIARRMAKAKPIMMPVEPNINSGNGSINYEPSTGLSRPVYPRTQLNISRGHGLDGIDSLQSNSMQHLYDPVTSSPIQMGVQLSNNIMYSSGNPANDMISSSPHTNTLSKRMGQQNSLQSFSMPPPPTMKNSLPPKHMIRPQFITSPSKKSPINGGFNLTPGKGMPCIVNPSSRYLKDDDAMSTYSTEELNQEMANLEGIMKDLNAITASEFEVNN